MLLKLLRSCAVKELIYDPLFLPVEGVKNTLATFALIMPHY